jgi:hypothetical protein
MNEQLTKLAENFSEEALPDRGRYLNDPAIADASGVLYIPPKLPAPASKWMIAAGLAVAGLLVAGLMRYGNKKKINGN